MNKSIDAIKKDIFETYIRRTPASLKKNEQAKSFLPGGDTRSIGYYMPYPIFGDRGKGCYVFDDDDNEYIDLVNNMTSLVNGHAHPVVVEALKSQLEMGTAHGLPNEAQSRLAELLVGRVPGMDLIRFNNSGSEATLYAMRAARAYTGRDKFIKIDGGYHGCHDFVQVNIFPNINSPGQPEAFVDKGVPSSVLGDMLVAPFNDLEIMENLLKENEGSVAAIMLEPLMGAGGGGLMAAEGYLQGLRSLADQYGTLLIFDEIITFRVHEGGWQGMVGVVPDLTTLGKIIGGGFPVGAFGGKRAVMEIFDPTQPGSVTHSGTFTGNPMSMVAGYENMKLYDQAAICRLNGLGDQFIKDINKAIKDTGTRGRLEGFGSMAVARFTDRDVRTAKEVVLAFLGYAEFLQYLHLEMLNRGISFLNRGLFNLSTPMDEALLEKVVAEFGDAFEKLKPLSDAISS